MEFFSEYLNQNNILSRIDVRIKILVSMAILAMVLSYKGFILPLLITLLCLLLCLKMRIPLRVLTLRFSEPLFLAFIILILKFFFSGENAIFSLNIIGIEITGHKDGLMDGLIIASRMLGAVSIVIVLGFATPFAEILAGLSWLRLPQGFIEILMFAYRYIFVLLEEAMVIYHAQRNRLGYSSISRGLGSFGTLAGSLILKAFDHSHHITIAMIQRGYDGNIPILKHKPFNPSEVIAGLLITITVGFIWKI